MNESTPTPTEVTPVSQGHKMLLAISRRVRSGKMNMYEGTVPEAVIAKRRAKNKIARKQRKVNRQARKNGSTK